MEYTKLFSKQEKHEIYKQVLFNIESGHHTWCCPAIIFVCNEDNNNYKFIDNIKYIFNELHELRTIFGNCFWFKNQQERIDALKKCIEMTK